MSKTPQEREAYKNRNLHHVKFTDEQEEGFKQFKAETGLNDNQALRHLCSTNPEFPKSNG